MSDNFNKALKRGAVKDTHSTLHSDGMYIEKSVNGRTITTKSYMAIDTHSYQDLVYYFPSSGAFSPNILNLGGRIDVKIEARSMIKCGKVTVRFTLAEISNAANATVQSVPLPYLL